MNDHSDRLGFILRTSVLLLCAVCLGKLNADPITLDNNPSVEPGAQSSISASAPLTNTIEVDVNSLPYDTPLDASDSVHDSRLTPNLTTSGLDLGFEEAIDSEAQSGTDASGVIYFEAGSGVSYSIAGSLTITSSDSMASINAQLTDLTQSSVVYAYQNMSLMGTGGSLALDSSGGSLSGSLTSGDVYSFYADEATNDGGGLENLNGSIGITFSDAPEPSTYAMLLGGMALLVLFARRRLA